MSRCRRLIHDFVLSRPSPDRQMALSSRRLATLWKPISSPLSFTREYSWFRAGESVRFWGFQTSVVHRKVLSGDVDLNMFRLVILESCHCRQAQDDIHHHRNTMSGCRAKFRENPLRANLFPWKRNMQCRVCRGSFWLSLRLTVGAFSQWLLTLTVCTYT